MRQPHGQPIVVGSGKTSRLEPASLSESIGAFNEAWLQRLIHDHPECLPVDEIEPRFDELVSVCMELPTQHGPMDNLLMTPEGDLIIVEVKLWRNPESRRKVVAQALDYASCLFEMDYAELERAVLKANFGGRGKPQRLYDNFLQHNPKDEAAFVDAVNANLRRGRALILVVGDGIRTEAARLASLVQSHAGAHFTFALVELSVFRMPGQDDFLVLPRTLAQTEMIPRAIIQINDHRTTVRLPDKAATHGISKSLPKSISAELFYDAMRDIDTNLPDVLQTFISKLEPLGVHPDFRRTLVLRWDSPTGKSVNLGYIMRNGSIYTDATSTTTPKDLAHSYIDELAAALDLTVAPGRSGDTWNLRAGGTAPSIDKLADRLDAWLPVIERFQERLNSKLGKTER